MMSVLSSYAAKYVSAKQGKDASDLKLPGVENQINSLNKIIADSQTKRENDLKSAYLFASQIMNEDKNIATLRKQATDLNAINAQKNDLIEQLKASNADINKQKAANTIDSASFKKDMDQNSKDFLTIIATLKIEVFGADSIKVDSSKSALIEKSDLKECTAQINSILP